MQILGISEVKYFNEKTQRDVHGFNFYLTYPSKKCIVGVVADKEYVPHSVISDMGAIPEVGDEIEFTYNRYGKVVGYTITSKEEK